ncbi:murein biosynthesis integral membrane protein MurJ [Marinobacter sp.]|uniref:murein biosynthesis integral membrane protein MurJ n=1 Tax=Marinobacter sp. TaxID=50741 RepID=UPI00384F1397
MPTPERRILNLFPKRLQARLAGLGSDHKQLARGLLLVGFFVLVGKFAGAAKEMAVAWRYGVSETVDAYLFVFNLVQWPIGILAGVIGAVLVPLAARLRQEAPQDTPRFRSELLGGTLLVALGLGIGAWLFLPWFVQQPWVGLNQGQAALAGEMATWLAWVLPLAMIARLLAAWTMAANRHLNTLLEGAPALAILVAVLFMGGTAPLIWGTLIGFFVQVLLLFVPLALRGEAEAPVFVFRSRHWRPFFAGFGLMLVGQGLMSLVDIIDQFFAARLGTGALSTLGYSTRILSLILGLGTIAIGRAALPVLSRTHAEGRAGIERTAIQWAILLFGAGLGIALVTFWLSPHIVELLYERGQFSSGDTLRVSGLLGYAVVQVPFYFASMILVYALLSQGRYGAVAAIAAANLAVKLGLASALVPAMGLPGLLLATAGVYLASGLLAARALLMKDERVKNGTG